MLAMILASVVLTGAGAEDGAEEVSEAVETVVEERKHTVVHANTLWDLAKHFYNDPFQWRRIYEANKADIKDPHWIYPDQVFVIPGFEGTYQVVKTRPAPPPPPAPEPAPEPEPAPAPVRFTPERQPGAIALPESLSTRIPEGQTGGQPSGFRFLMPPGWKAAGRVVSFAGRESLAAEGDTLVVRLDAPLPLRRGLRFTVFRPSAPTEADLDQKATYMQKVGLVEAAKKLSDTELRVTVLKAGGAIQVGDLVQVGE